jgi:hypothetical protein
MFQEFTTTWASPVLCVSRLVRGSTVLFAKSASTAIIQLQPSLLPAFSRTSRKFHEIGMAAGPFGN